MTSSIIPTIIETMMNIRTTPIGMKNEKGDRRREKGDSDEDEELAKPLAMALMAMMEVRTMIMNAKTVRKIKRKIIQRCR